MEYFDDKQMVVRFFSQHIVPMLFLFEKDDRRQQFIITSFVLSVSNHWFLLSAGHCFNQMKKELINAGWIIKKCYLIDFLGINANFNDPIPFTFDIEKAFFFPEINDKDFAFDYGIYPLSIYFQKLLISNNIKPLNEEVWKKQPESFEFFLLLGIPAELVRYEVNDIQLFASMFFVDVLPEKPNGFKDVSLPQIYGKITLNSEIKSIKGMSGGPVFGLKKNDIGEFRYWLVSLLSRWLPESHLIATCPTKLIGEAIDSYLSQIYTS